MNPETRHFDRRWFLKGLSCAAAAPFLESLVAGVQDARTASSVSCGHSSAAAPTILKLRLMTAAPIAEMRAFYHDRLGFRVLSEDAGEIAFAGGLTEISFVKVEETPPHPFYHFAFNIPENKIRLARAWQLERSALITTPDHLRDPDYPDDVRHFRHWDAHSVFFWDPAGNLVEYIARHELPNAADGPFTSADILHASEIGLVIDDPVRDAVAATLRDTLGFAPYKLEAGGPFFAMGNAHGLVLLLTNGQRRNVDPDRVTVWDVFPTQAVLKGVKPHHWGIHGYPYLIESVGVGT